MGRLTRAAVLLAAAVSCTSAPVPPPAPPAEVPRPERLSPAPPAPPGAEPPPDAAAPTALDLFRWPFGWVDDAFQGSRLGRPARFWSDHRLLWLDGLDPAARPSAAVRKLEAAFGTAGSTEEAFRAAWHLRRLYSLAGLADDARIWLDRAAALDPANPLLNLDRLWDQVFRLADPSGARMLWPSGGFGALVPADAAKAALLRQKLFLGTWSLASSGADEFVSFLTLDRDDLWVGTWNGAVVRRSLSTGQTDLLLKPVQVAPVVRLAVTGWFVYAFQDQALLRYSKVTGTWRSFAYPPGWTGLRVTGAVPEGDESLLVGHLGQGVWRFDRGTWSAVDTGASGPFVTALGRQDDGSLLVGTKDRGLWVGGPSGWAAAGGPTDISVLAPEPGTARWAVGTWGEGTWVWASAKLVRSGGPGTFAAAAAWSEGAPLWGLVDGGLVWERPGSPAVLGPREGLPPGGVTALVVRDGRWIWGTMGQGLAWWSENEDPALLR